MHSFQNPSIITVEDRGTFEFDTVTGSTYLLNKTDEGTTLLRRPGMNAPADGFLASRLKKDFDEIAVLGHQSIAVGQPAILILEPLNDNGPTTRFTSQVTAIRQPPAAG